MQEQSKALEYKPFVSVPSQPQMLLVKQLQGACSDWTQVEPSMTKGERQSQRKTWDKGEGLLEIRGVKYANKASHLGLVLPRAVKESAATAPKLTIT